MLAKALALTAPRDREWRLGGGGGVWGGGGGLTEWNI